MTAQNRVQFTRPSGAMEQQGNGFTLVELAIALMVIGLLIGGVLKGQELIENARITRTVKDINDFDTAIMIFRNTYNALPGDIRHPSRIPNCNASPCNLPGTGDGLVYTTLQAPDITEFTNFWVHLYHAGLIADYNREGRNYTTSPINAFGGHTSFWHRDEQIITGEALHRYSISEHQNNGSARIKLKRTIMLDRKMDDGVASTGRVGLIVKTGAPICHDADTLDYLQTGNPDCYNSIASQTAD